MPFIDLPTVRKHLVAANIPASDVHDARVTLHTTDTVQLPHGNLLGGSVRVKIVKSDVPTLETSILLVDEDFTMLQSKHFVPGSVVVAADRALTTVFTEELDFRVEYGDGALARVATGSIPNTTPVQVWYDSYIVYQEDADYILNLTTGSLRRTATSAIPDGATVLVDYTVANGAAEDELIEQAIIEAEDIIIRNLRPGFSSASTDQGLKTGACYLTLAHVAGCMSALALTRHSGTDAHSRAREWLALANQWNDIAWNVLAPFVTPHRLRAGEVD